MSRRSTAAAADRAVKATTSRHISLFWPPMIWASMWIVAEVTYLVFHYLLPTYRDWMIFCGTVALGGLCFAVLLMSRSRVKNPQDTHAVRGVIYATATAVVSSLWIMAGLIGNPLSPGLMVVWGFFGMIAVVLWIIRMVMERKDSEAHTHGQPSRRGAAAAFLEATTGVTDIEAHVIEATPDRIDIGIDVTESEIDLDGIRAALPKVAASIGVAEHRTTVVTHPNHAGKGTMRLVRRDILAEPIPWPGPAHPGGTPFDFYPKGKYLDTTAAGLQLADKSGVRHQITTGMSGSGKSGGARVEAAEHITRRETSVTVIDVMKKTLTMGPLAEGLDLFIIDQDTARSFLSILKRALSARFNYLAAMGLDNWEPGCGLQFWPILIEEASFLEIPDRFIVDLTKILRGCGGRLYYSLQSSHHTQMSTVARSQFSGSAVYGCQDSFEADQMPDDVRKAGAAPEQWRDEQPGMNYLCSKGIPRDRQAMPLRDYEISREQMLWVARNHPAQPLDAVTAEALGALYLNRPSGPQVVEQERRKAFGEPAPEARRERVEVQRPADPDDQGLAMDIDEDEDEDDGQHEDDGRPSETDLLTPEELGVVTPYEGTDVNVSRDEVRGYNPTVRPEDDFPIGPQTDPGYTPTTESTEWMRAEVDKQIAAWEAAGQLWIRPADFVDTDLCGPTGPHTRKRTWFNKDFDQRLVPSGRLEDRDTDIGKYRILPLAASVAVG